MYLQILSEVELHGGELVINSILEWDSADNVSRQGGAQNHSFILFASEARKSKGSMAFAPGFKNGEVQLRQQLEFSAEEIATESIVSLGLKKYKTFLESKNLEVTIVE